MVIPSGDLAPMRKHRRGYGRHPRRWPVVVAVLAVAAIAGGTYALQHRTDNTGQATAPSTCVSASPAATPAAALAKPTAVRLPAPGQVSLRLLNGSGRDGLARSVANELARRGFRVTYTGNAPRPLAGASRVNYGPGGLPSALLVSAHVLGSSVVPVPTAGRGAIDVVLGSAFARLRTPAETSAYVRLLLRSGPPAPEPTASLTRITSCR